MSPRRSCSASSADAREALPNARETLRLPGVFLSVVTRRLRYGSSPVIAHILLLAAAALDELEASGRPRCSPSSAVECAFGKQCLDCSWRLSLRTKCCKRFQNPQECVAIELVL